MSKKLPFAAFSLLVMAVVFFIGSGASLEAAPRGNVPTIEAKPVLGLSVGPRKKLWVFVFPAPGGVPGKPPKEDEETPAVSCAELDQPQSETVPPLGFALPRGGVTFKINDGSIPIDVNATIDAINRSFDAWESVIGDVFTVDSTGGASGPAEDGIHSVGWVKIVPKNVLAATWVWEVNGIVTDVDVFYNTFHKWANLDTCGGSKFDVENVGTHEVGHVIGLSHLEDTDAMATMYPSAPKGEIKKRTLTTGDISGATAIYP